VRASFSRRDALICRVSRSFTEQWFMTVRSQWLIALAAVAGFAATCLPAAAQFWGDRYPGYYQQGPYPFFGNGMPPPVVDSTKAPPPRKLAAPPTSTVVVIGDSMADWLGYGLDETYSDQPNVGVERKIRAYGGLIHYDSKNDTLDWPQVTKDALATETPNAIIIMLGLNDRVSLRDKPPPAKSSPQKNADQKNTQQKDGGQSAPAAQTPQQDKTATPVPSDAEAPPQGIAIASDAQHPVPGGSYDFHTDPWAALYAKRIEEMIAAVKAKGVPVLWVGLPAIRGTKSTSDMAYLDELYRERAEKAGIVYVDIWDGFVDDQGRYTVEGPDFEGQTRRLRTGDGVHFTKAGAVKLASYVDLELRRVMTNHVVPVALPEEKPQAKPGAPRPDVGPVLPLTAGGGETGDLLGAGSHPAPATSDPLATRVLSRGDPIAPPAGRADDFSWPRPADDASAATDVVLPVPAALTPAAPAKKGAAKADDSKKPADAKKDAKNKPTADSSSAKNAKPPAGGF
jgi:uncharacterized protein